MEQSGEEAEADGFVGKLTRRTRSGCRLWSAEIKGRAVFESMKPDARVCDVARRYGVKAQQLTTWRRLARAGRLALVTDDAADFVSIELSDPVASGKSEGPSRLRLARFRSAWMRTCRRCGSRRS
ncbi:MULTISPECIES: transposase [Bradyrhizobium]|jgi:transposase|uniref:Blr1865 protein n=6 Tax=Nitrobacteraceae TaxID=41294 RepID=Q89TN3_BRADU|nr:MULTISPECIES: transposase [Bradyrhizobium]AHY48465.1 transposase [Bradyrhizobium japonicum SEMIA 5079]BAC47130.1 blr1865 [Bradyrhizobium diazoefficiens USDA 110]APO50483.1 transposase [Bradyrhizobium diazoefficiens]MEB2678043.1 transposase [Bradyrhizobium japonicum]WRI70299.1 transposase [Bradyrhizobium japonicum]